MCNCEFLSTLDDLRQVSWIVLRNDVNIPKVMRGDGVIVDNVEDFKYVWVIHCALNFNLAKHALGIDFIFNFV